MEQATREQQLDQVEMTKAEQYSPFAATVQNQNPWSEVSSPHRLPVNSPYGHLSHPAEGQYIPLSVPAEEATTFDQYAQFQNELDVSFAGQPLQRVDSMYTAVGTGLHDNVSQTSANFTYGFHQMGFGQ